MVVSLDSVIYLCFVAIIWGVTNPFIKKGAQGLEDVKATSFYGQFIKEFIFLITNLKYLLPFLLNQCGSVLYFLTLQSTDLSLALPVSNSLTFVFTAITGWFLGEEKVHRSMREIISISNGKWYELVTLRSALFFRYLSGNDAYTVWNYVVLLGQTK